MNSIKEEIAKNLAFYRKKIGLTQKELAEKLGVRHNSISAWENEKNSIDVEVLFDICKILGVTINDMYGVALNDSSFTNQEKTLIDYYRNLTPSGKTLISDNIKSVLKYEKHQAQSQIVEIESLRKTVPLLGIVSAGNGIENYFDRDDVEVENDCDFALIVRGDSMEPVFHDNQIVGIQKRNTLENGEIGIIEWINEDGSRKAYLKKWHQLNGKVKLVSLNPKYDDLIIEKGKLEVRGKVFMQ